MIEQITNYVRNTDRIGSGGQPSPGQFDLIAAAGYRAVINLAPPDRPGAIDDEGAFVAGRSMSYVQIPVPWEAPQREHVRDFCLIMRAFEPRLVFVHCMMNYRASAFIFHYLTKVVGLDPKLARSPIFETWAPDTVWSELLGWSAQEIGLA